MKHFVELSSTFTFQASHLLIKLPEGHPCKRLHGHSYEVTVWIGGELDDVSPWHTDLDELEQTFDSIKAQVCHRHLNDIPGMLTTSVEHVAWWMFRRIKREHSGLLLVEVSEGTGAKVRVHSGGPLSEKIEEVSNAAADQ